MIKSIYRSVVPEKLRLQLHIALRKMKARSLKGDAFYCPCCGNSSSAFLPKGNGITVRLNAECAHCGSLERTRLFYLYLKNETGIFSENPKVLHFAPEAILKQKLVGNPNYVDADINPNLARVQMDITDITFPDSHFDFIICSHVLGHIPDELKALSELYRVLKPGGSLFLLSLFGLNLESTVEEDNSSATPAERLRKYGEHDLERLYGADFAVRISRPEITVERIDYRKHFSPAERDKMALGDGTREIIYKVKRKAVSS